MKKLKFISLNELARRLNADQPASRHYTIAELACAWADARAKYYQATGKKVKKGVHFIMNAQEPLLSPAGCKLITRYATVDGYIILPV